MSELRPGDVLGGFVIERELGRGGMGAVFLANDERLGRRVALKVIVASLAADPAFRARFEREARIAATLEHPHVVPVYDVGESDGRLFIAMRFIAGRDLATELREHGAVAPTRVARLLGQVGAALDAAHHAGLVHRDVKPANVLLAGSGPDEHAYLTDFGLTREAASDSGLTGTGEWIGTIDYAAPEHISLGAIDARTDVYAVACLAFHALTGRVPFGGSMPAKVHGHLAIAPPRATAFAPTLLPPDVNAILACGMAKDPEERFASAGDLARELTAAVTGQPNIEPARTVATGRALTGIPVIGHRAAAPAPPVDRKKARAARTPHTAETRADQITEHARRTARPRVVAALVGALLLAGGAGAAVAFTGGGAGEPSTPTTSAPAAATTTVERVRTETVERTVSTPAATTAAEDRSSEADRSPETIAPEPRATPALSRFTTGQDAGQTTPAAACAVVRQALKCWTPNDGFTVSLPRYGHAQRIRADEVANRGREPGYAPLGFGEPWSSRDFRCISRRSGLTCTNADGHGWTLPRYRGLPAYF